jgi:hypothetical protein
MHTQPAPTFPVGARPVCHKTGQVTYWSASQRSIVPLARTMSGSDYLEHGHTARRRLLKHFHAHGWNYSQPLNEWTASPTDR